MKIILISPYPDVAAYGIRTMSAYLKQSGHQTKLIFLPDFLGNMFSPPEIRYDDGMLDGIIPLCRDADLIGITLMTSFYDSAAQITKKIKSALKTPVIWGGVHPTMQPDDCLTWADMVCIGDGEEVLLELANRMQAGKDYANVQNLVLKRNDHIIRNPIRPLEHELDRYPAPDRDIEDHFLLTDSGFKTMTHELWRRCLQQVPATSTLTECGYMTMTGRGCPHRCTYCMNDKFKSLYGAQNYLRWRNNEHVMEELLWVKRNMPYVSHIMFADDAFFAKNIEVLQDFCRQYKELINLPFAALASPLTMTEEKMALLVDTGLRSLQMGIESGSTHMLEVFNRQNMSKDKVMQAARIIIKYKDVIVVPYYDFIIDAPFETDQDHIETLRFISRLPKPYRYQTFSARVYPGTKLYAMAKQEGIIKEDCRFYSKKRRGYLKLVFIAGKSGKLPGWLLRFLVSAPVVLVLNSSVLKPVIEIFELGVREIFNKGKSLAALLRGKKRKAVNG
jgi:anaerobic magnesium-protoporphyrin IX monomethyl ester cyclase